ncbi:MAG TPA: FAD-binding protein [Flavipsychrobacter sp.]|nr:FAD-binding protein [Flavipsychrobacter sp.]
MKIVKNGPQLWENLHCTVKQPITDLYDLVNETTGTPLENYHDTTRGIQDIMADCIRNHLSLRALGGSWSFTPIAATDGIILNTRGLNSVFTISASSLNPNYKGKPEELSFVQCGNSIWELNNYLNPRGRSLKTCGASNGQTIVGAMSTGTHGSAIDFGAIQDYVKGLHIITGPNSDVYLERKSYPVVSETFIAKLNTSLIQDDELFNAALVSMGGMGFIHGVMIETEPLFLLECSMRKVPFDQQLFDLMTRLDFKHPQLPYADKRPFQFQVMINPYDMKNGVMMTTMYKQPYRKDYTPPEIKDDVLGPGDDAPCFIGKLTQVAKSLVPAIVNNLLAASLKPYEKKIGTLAEIFNNFNIRGKVASAAVGVAKEDCIKALELLLKMNEEHHFVGLFACRFVKKSDALLAFTRFDHTCIIELDGVLSKESLKFYDLFCDAMEKSGIAFTYHWGKMNLLNADRVKRMYGDYYLRFLFARNKLLQEPMLQVFNNSIFKDWGFENGGNARSVWV